MKINKNEAWKKFADRLFAPLLTLTELLAITVTTFSPPKNPLTPVAIPKARKSLLILERLFKGSNLSTALILSKDSITATKVMDNVCPMNSEVRVLLKFGLGKEPMRFSGSVIIRAGFSTCELF